MSRRHQVKYRLTESDILAMPDAELARESSIAVGILSRPKQALVLAVAQGVPPEKAAADAGISASPSNLSSLLHQPAVKKALRLLAEQARRKTQITLESVIAWFDSLAYEARRAGDFNAARAAKAELAKLLRFYPDARLTVQHELLDTREVTPAEIEALSLLRHGVRRQLPGQVIEADFVPGPVPGDHEARGREAEAGDCSSQDQEKEAADAP